MVISSLKRPASHLKTLLCTLIQILPLGHYLFKVFGWPKNGNKPLKVNADMAAASLSAASPPTPPSSHGSPTKVIPLDGCVIV